MTKSELSQEQRAIIIHPVLKGYVKERDEERRLYEAEGLARAIYLNVVRAEIANLPRIIPSSYIGKGKIEEYKNYIEQNNIDLVIIDTAITPVQQRNLEKSLAVKVIDRTALILEIFGERASTKEGRLQVELAAYEYQKSRLVRSWTHLERQRGGGGFMGGPGEKQIESDKRMINERIQSLKKQLSKIVKTRTLHRKSRKDVPYEVVSLVGYTNAGKSTLFNRLSGADVMAKDMLFATLDPTMRLIKLPSGKQVIMSDTVGFISELPTELVAAFRATLEEVTEADVIIHVRDISASDAKEQKKDVINVLKSLGLEDKMADSMVEVYNKIDLLSKEEQEDWLLETRNNNKKVAISAVTGYGIENFLKVIDDKLASNNFTKSLKLKFSEGKKLAWLYQHANVLERHDGEDFVNLKVNISKHKWEKFKRLG